MTDSDNVWFGHILTKHKVIFILVFLQWNPYYSCDVLLKGKLFGVVVEIQMWEKWDGFFWGFVMWRHYGIRHFKQKLINK